MPSLVPKLKTLKGNVDLDNEVSGFSSTSSPRAIRSKPLFLFSFLSETLESGFISFLSIIFSRAFGNKPSLCHSREMLKTLPETLDSPLESFCRKSQGLFWAESLVWYLFFKGVGTG